MDPLTMALISGGIAAGGSAIGAIPQIVPTLAEKELKKDYKKLQRREELGLLGLTPEEQRVMEQQLSAKTSQSQALAQAQRNQLMAGNTMVQGGQTLLQDTLRQEAADRAAAQADAQIAAQNLAKKQQEEQMLRDMEAAISEQQMLRREALASPFVAGSQAAVGSLLPSQVLGGGPAGYNYASVISQQYNIPLDDAKKIEQKMRETGQTELLDYFMLVR